MNETFEEYIVDKEIVDKKNVLEHIKKEVSVEIFRFLDQFSESEKEAIIKAKMIFEQKIDNVLTIEN